MTQQGLSGVLRRLRGIFADPLFVRGSHGVLPTPKAEALYPRVMAVIESLREVMEPETFDPLEVEATIRIAADDYALAVLIEPLFGKMRKVAPRLRLAIEPLRVDTLSDRLQSDQVDLALTVPEFVPDNLHTRILFADEYKCVVRKGHPTIDGDLTLDGFCQTEHLLVSPNRGDFRGATDDALVQIERARRISLVVPSFLVATAILESTDLIGVLPSRLVTGKTGTLQVLNPPLSITPFDIISVWHERLSSDALNIWFRDLLSVLVSDM